MTTFVKHIGFIASKTAGTTLAWTWPLSAAAGSVVVCCLVFDNAATASKPVVTSISKPAGETANWVFLGASRSTSTSAGAFSSGEMWAIKTTVAWTTPAITATFDTSVTMRSMGFSEFIRAEAALRSTVGTAYSTTTTAASATTTGTVPSIGDLALGLIFQSNTPTTPSGDNDTSGGTWSAPQSVGSSGSSAATNNMGGFQRKILTAAVHQTVNNQATLTAGNGVIAAILRGLPEPAITQAAYRFDAEGTETGSVALAAQDTACSANVISADANVLLRIRLQSTSAVSVAATDDFQLQVEKNGSGTWITIDEYSTTVVQGYSSPNLTDSATTTNRLTGGTGSFVAGKVSEDGLVDDLGWTATNYTEVLYTVRVIRTDVAHGDTLRFRVLLNGATTGMTYTQTPTINVIKSAPKVETLTDDFATTVDKTTKWSNSSAQVVWDASGRAAIPLSNVYYVMQTPPAGSYDLTGSALFARMYPTLGGNGTRECFMEIIRGGTTNDKLTMFASGGDFNVRKTVAGANTSGPGALFNATTHAWWKISESGGTIYFHTSLDGVTWAQFWSTPSGFDITNVYVNFTAGWYGSDPGGAYSYVDSVNIPGTPVSLPKLSTLIDTFDTQIDPAKWAKWGETYWVAGQLQVQPGANPGYGGVYSANLYDFTESSVFVKVTLPSFAGTTARECMIQIYLDDNNMIAVIADSGGGLYLRIRQGGVNTNLTGLVYNATDHAWWRVRMAGTTVYFDTSPDGGTWTNQKSGTTSLTLTAVKFYMLTGQWAAEAGTAPASFDNVNSAGAAPPVTGRPKVWTGSTWAQKPAKVWTGSAWVEKPMKRWTGTEWKVV